MLTPYLPIHKHFIISILFEICKHVFNKLVFESNLKLASSNNISVTDMYWEEGVLQGDVYE